MRLAPRKPASSTNRNLGYLNYVDPESQLPLNTSLARRNTSKCKQSFQNRNGKYLAKREPHLNRSRFPPIKQYSTNNPNNHTDNDPKLASVLFAFNQSTNQLSSFSKLNHYVEINYIRTTTHKMPSKKRITKVRFNDASHRAIPSSSTATSSCAANQATDSANATCAPNQPATPPTTTRTANPGTQHPQPYLLTPAHPSHQAFKSLHLVTILGKSSANH